MSKTEHPHHPPNHLKGQTSPYLLQHLYNPVDWYPWGPEALDRAAHEQKPIFLSIGYAACHWCHVMERESFEDPEIAAYLNEHFVAIKVDREERPDLDEIYMNAVQLMTGQGGWPMSVFLAPDRRPFFGGTYFPPQDRYGRPGFAGLLRRIHELWIERREEIDESATRMVEQLEKIARGGVEPASGQRIGIEQTSRAAAELTARFDPAWGGFGPAPKFPPDGALALLLRNHQRSAEPVALQMVETTLHRMGLGGMYDHIGGGFARYSVDEKWLVPHFEKMLYNQALLVPVYVDAWRITGKPLYRRIVEQTLDFVRREQVDPGGGFHSSLDADSEGEEGKFYVWTPSEIMSELGAEDGRLFCETYGITPEGNFEGQNIPNLLAGSLFERARDAGHSEEQLDARLEPLRRRMLAARERRARPGTDDKVLTAWNGLMITAFSRAHQALGRPEDLAAARGAADFLLGHALEEDRLKVSYREGQARLNAYLDEYAFLARGLLDLYESCFVVDYINVARLLARTLIARFADADKGGFFFTSDDHERLPTRSRSTHDGALPAGAGVACEVLLRLAVHFDDEELRHPALRMLDSYYPMVCRTPSAYASLLIGADFAEGPVSEVAVVGQLDDPSTRALLEVVRRGFRPRLAVALGAPGAAHDGLALLAGKTAVEGRPTAYVCRDYACLHPTTEPDELERQLDAGT